VFNVALALAFVISNLAAPGGRLLSIVFEQEALRTLPPYQQVLLTTFANYWLPALVIYILLRMGRANRYVVPSRATHIVLGLANALLVLYLGLRVFTSTVQGGGATFALVSIAAYPVKASQWVLVGGLAWVVATSIWRTSRGLDGPKEDRRPLLRTASGLAAIVLFMPPLGFFSWVYATKAPEIHAASKARQTREARFEQLCQNIDIDIRRTVTDVKSVFFSSMSELAGPLRKKLNYVEARNVDGTIVRTIQRDKPLASPPPGEFPDFSREVVPEPTAPYEISMQSLSDKGDREIGLGVLQFTVADRSTGEVLATFTEVSEIRGVRVEKRCPSQFGHYRYDLVGYVLGLHEPDTAKQIASKIAALQTRVAE
jgi:hypothetical protein